MAGGAWRAWGWVCGGLRVWCVGLPGGRARHPMGRYGVTAWDALVGHPNSSRIPVEFQSNSSRIPVLDSSRWAR